MKLKDYEELEEVDLEEEFPDLEVEEDYCVVCGKESEFIIDLTLEEGLKVSLLLCKEHYKLYKKSGGVGE